KRVHTVTINMPNLTSGSGSWVLRFAELNGDGVWREEDEGDLSAPVALRKVDPKYAPSAVRDRVEGTVLLAAHILRDGTVSNIEVLNTLDPRLDGSAMDALTRWEFQPATKNGIPIDLEVLIQIPFRLPVF
ncbi:MAG: energy transducer TonB, partial [Acidobacteria bacterium]|nr:energy transducer TonB [Acidobacteriota bacterium]